MRAVLNEKGSLPHSVLWRVNCGLAPYLETVAAMEEAVAGIRDQGVPEQVWLLEHPALYTAGTGARKEDLLDARFPVYPTGRGGQYTYHGPGQRIAYAMMDLHRRGDDLRRYVQDLEAWAMAALKKLRVEGHRREGLIGVWVGDHKIVAVGVRVRKWVAYHGLALNVAPDLSHYAGIIPCGVREGGITSLEALGKKVCFEEVDRALQVGFEEIFGPVSFSY